MVSDSEELIENDVWKVDVGCRCTDSDPTSREGDILGELIVVGEVKTLNICEFCIDKDEDTLAGLEMEDCGIAN